MRFLLPSLFAALVVLVSSCNKVEENPGCTDPTAINYNSQATTDDNSCEYNNSATISFWQDFANSQAIEANNSASLIKFYIDGIETGAMLNDTYSAVEPPCGNGGYVATVNIGNNNTGSAQYEIRIYDGSNWIVFQNGTVNLTASGCSSIQVTY